MYSAPRMVLPHKDSPRGGCTFNAFNFSYIIVFDNDIHARLVPSSAWLVAPHGITAACLTGSGDSLEHMVELLKDVPELLGEPKARKMPCRACNRRAPPLVCCKHQYPFHQELQLAVCCLPSRVTRTHATLLAGSHEILINISLYVPNNLDFSVVRRHPNSRSMRGTRGLYTALHL